jgi:hypothetical protein
VAKAECGTAAAVCQNRQCGTYRALPEMECHTVSGKILTDRGLTCQTLVVDW